MTLSRATLAEIERAVVKGWPAIETEAIGGWLARWSSGGSVRANTVATTGFDGSLSLDAAIERVVAFYRRQGGIAKFTITGTSAPLNLDTALEARGWHREGQHVTLSNVVGSKQVSPIPPLEIEQSDKPDDSWFDAYLQGLSDDRREIATRLVQGVPHPRAFFKAKRDGITIASGLSVVDGSLASVQCMATLASARRTGAASAILAAIETNARLFGTNRLYLQTDAENTAARSLYERVGFELVDRYHTRVSPR